MIIVDNSLCDILLTGRRFYLFDGNILLPDYPKPLTALGLPEELDYVDAATVWGHNSKTYIFSGTLYWRYDDETERMELDYPRDMAIWRGVGNNINAAFQWHDGKCTYSSSSCLFVYTVYVVKTKSGINRHVRIRQYFDFYGCLYEQPSRYHYGVILGKCIIHKYSNYDIL